MTKQIIIDDYVIDDESPTFIIAELSANHNGSLKLAIKSIMEAAKSNADAIKLQTYKAETITLNCKTDIFKINQGTIWDGRYLYDLYSEAYTPWEWHEELFKVAREEGLICFSSPFDPTAVDLLESLNVPAYKIASFEITDIPLIEYVASKGKPIIISTGIAGISDIELAIDACKRMKNDQIVILKCTSQYPAKIEDANLITITDIKKRFGVYAGLSDHTMSEIVPITAVALGAKVIEKHFIINRNIGGADASFSLNPSEFKRMVKGVRQAEISIGCVDYEIIEKKKTNRKFSRSLFVVANVKAGEKVSIKNVRSIRPANGLHPKYYHQLIGMKFKTDLEMGTPLSWDYVK